MSQRHFYLIKPIHTVQLSQAENREREGNAVPPVALQKIPANATFPRSQRITSVYASSSGVTVTPTTSS